MDENETDQKVGLGRAEYAVGTVLVAYGLIDFFASAVVPQVEAPVAASQFWRFRMVGLIGGQLTTLVVGMLLLMLAAIILGHKRVLRALGVLFGALAVLASVVIVFFFLDAATVQEVVAAQPEPAAAIARATRVVLMKLSLFMVAVGVLARESLRISRPPTRKKSGRKRTTPLIVTGNLND